MIERRDYDTFSWIHFSDPHADEVRPIAEEFGIHVGVAEELLLPSSRPHAEVYDDHLYLVLHFPALRRSHVAHDQEIDFVIGKNVVVTAHYEHVDTLHKFEKTLAIANAKHATYESAFDMFAAVVKRLYRSVEHEAEAIEDVLENIERDIFLGEEKEMVIVLSKTARDILNLRQSLEPHEEILQSLAEEVGAVVPEGAKRRVRNLQNLRHRVMRRITRLSQTLAELRATNDSLLTTKQNEVVKTLTIMAFLTFPLTLVAGIFSMNTTHTPLVGAPYDFWILVGSMVFAAALMFMYFKNKRWL